MKNSYFTVTALAVCLVGGGWARAAVTPVPAGTPEIPGVLQSGTSALFGNILTFEVNAFSGGAGFNGGATKGSLRSMVVNRGTGLDFCYQILNSSTDGVNNGNDIFRFVAPNFTGNIFTTFLSGDTPLNSLTNFAILPTAWLTTQAGTTALGPSTADRDTALAGINGVGFDFSSSYNFNQNVPGGPTTAAGNLEAGQIGKWLVVRTDFTAFADSEMEIVSGAGSAAESLTDVTIGFRNQTTKIPSYTVPRFLLAGATIGPLPGDTVPATPTVLGFAPEVPGRASVVPLPGALPAGAALLGLLGVGRMRKHFRRE